MNLSLSVSQWEGGSQPASQSQAGWDCMAGTAQTAQQLSEPGVWRDVYSNNPRTRTLSPAPCASCSPRRRPGAPQYVPSSGRVQPRLCPPDYFLKRLCQWASSSSRCSARLAPAQTGCCLNSQPTPRSVDPRPWQWTHAAQPRDTR